jgi:hypothetical protein
MSQLSSASYGQEQVGSSVALALTVHEADKRLAAQIAAQLPALAQCYAAVVAFCSHETDAGILELLRAHGVAVHRDGEPSAGIDRMGQVRRETLRAGLLAGTSHLQLCDFDRAIHWIAFWPDELREVIASISDYDLLVLGRTDRAWSTHPAYQAETEPLFNRVFALVTGLPWDVGAGSRGFSREAATWLLATSQEQTVGADAEWPLLLLRRDGLRVGYRRCEGLEFETADRFAPEIEAAGGRPEWLARQAADPRRWVFRLRLALLIAEAAVRQGLDQE